MCLQIAPGRLEIVEGAFAGDEAQLHQPAGRVINEHQQRAGRTAVLEPVMLTAVDLDQLTQAVTTLPRLVDAWAAILARGP